MTTYEISLSVVGPVMTAGEGAVAHGLDTPFLRDHTGAFIIAGTHLRGVLREILEQMAAAAPQHLSPVEVADWFGAPSSDAREAGFDAEAPRWDPQRGRLHFTDLRYTPAGPARPPLTRIAVDATTGSVLRGALQVVEQPVGVGETVTFTGRLVVTGGVETAERIVGWLEEARKLVPAIGGQKSAGFGRVDNIAFAKIATDSDAAAVTADQAAALASGDGVAVTLTFEGPFLVSSASQTGNVFHGAETVSGAVLKGALATLHGADDDAHPLHAALAGAVFQEFRPATAASPRPCTAPLSLAHVPDEPMLVDALEDDLEFYSVAAAGVAAYALDWKYDDVGEALATVTGKSAEPKRYLRTRTAMKDGLAEDARLFSQSAVMPGEFVWKGRILRGGLDEAAFAALLQALPQRLTGIGKMRTAATVAVAPLDLTPAAPRGGQRWRLVLETPACLHAPADVAAVAAADDPAVGLKASYAAYFVGALAERGGPAVAADDLDLVFFATQRWAGGYLAGRYPVADDGYQPWLLTEAGSVFEVTVPAGSEAAVASFACRGLPPPVRLTGRRRQWQGNPFVPENGFGEVRLIPGKEQAR